MSRNRGRATAGRRLRIAFVATLWPIVAIAAQGQARFAGSKACAGCHEAEFRRQSASTHAAALSPAREHPSAPTFSSGKLDRKPGYRFDFFLSSGELRTRIRDQADVMELPMEWAFGAGAQAITFVTRVDERWYLEHYSTWYPSLKAWGPTPGQAVLRPASLAEAAGVLYKRPDPANGISACFECHSTGPVSFTASGEVRLTEAGVHCEACHGAGAAHAENPQRHHMRNPARLTAAQLNEFCGRCHRPPASNGVAVDWNYAWNVRHQPVYLAQSTCFRQSRGMLSCLTCHDPHDPAGRKPAAAYNGRCLECHGKTAAAPKPTCLERSPANCIDCHMPLVSPQSPLRFTNHWIGVYGDGAKLKPVRN
jgi:hypothetical protein